MSADRGSLRYHRGAWELTAWSHGRRTIRRHHAPDTRAGRRAAEKALEQLLTQIGAGTETATVADVLTAYETARSADWSPSTQATHRHLAKPLVDAFGTTPAHLLTVATIEAVYGTWRADGLAASSIRRRHAVLSAAMIHAERWGTIAHAPTRNVRLPRPSETPQVALPDVAAVLDAIDRIDAPAWLPVAARITIATGMRRGELAALRWADVDLKTGTLNVRGAIATGPDGQLTLKATKSRRAAVVEHLDPGTIETLRSWRHERRQLALRLGTSFATDWPVIGSPSDPRAWITPDRITRSWIRHRKAIGLPSLRWHDLRHVNASEMIAAGIDPVAAAARLGHDPSMLLGRYAHARPAADQAAAQVIADADAKRRAR